MKDYKDFDRYTWYLSDPRDTDVVVSTRIRLARNLRDYPFSPRLDETGAKEIISKVRAVPELADYEYTDFCELSPAAAVSFAERHIASAEFANVKGPHGLLSKPDSGVYIMLCEEDHVRLQCIRTGFDLDGAYAQARDIEESMDRALEFAYSEKFGYLTHCPTNLGTGMRASVMLFLPALSAAGEIGALQNQLMKLGLTVRGSDGEGSGSDGCLFQISNQVTLGISEEETVKKLSGIAKNIIERERGLREKIGGDRLLRLRDSVRRAIGVMRYAELIDTKELFRLYSRARLGAAMNMTDGITCEAFDRLLFSAMPATITASRGEKLNSSERDAARAEMARELVSV